MKIRISLLVLLGALASWPLPVAAAPTFSWSAEFNSMFSEAEPRSGSLTGIAMTPDGNVVTAAALGVGYPNSRLHVLKHRPDGALLWSFDDSGLNTSGAAGLSVDAQGNIFCAAWIGAWTGSMWTGGDIVILKITSAGVQSWRKVFDAGGAERPVAVLADGAGGVYVAGWAEGANGRDALLVRFHSDGEVQWVGRFDGEAHGYDEALAMTALPGGDVAICGSTTSVAAGRNFLTIRYSPAGAVRWIHVWDVPGAGGDVAKAILADAGGDVFVGGDTIVGSRAQPAILRLNSGGTLQWSIFSSASGQTLPPSPGFRGMALDGLGKLAYVTSTVSYIHEGQPWMWETSWLTGLSAAGAVEWQRGLAGQEFYGLPTIDRVIGLPAGGFVAGGTFSINSNDPKTRTLVSVRPDGMEDWRVTGPFPLSYYGGVSGMAVGNDGIYMSGAGATVTRRWGWLSRSG